MNRPKCSNCRGAPSAAQRRGGRTPFRRSSGRAVISVAHLIMRKVILRVSAPHDGKTVFVTTLGGRPRSASWCVGVCRATQPTEREHAVKLTSVFVERTLSQFEAEAIPDNHPAVPQLRGLFGDHTFFLDGNGLNIVEPAEPLQEGVQAGQVINLASWDDEDPPN